MRLLCGCDAASRLLDPRSSPRRLDAAATGRLPGEEAVIPRRTEDAVAVPTSDPPSPEGAQPGRTTTRVVPRAPRPDARDVPRDRGLAIVRTSLEAYWRGERSVAAARWDPDIVWRVAGSGPVSGEHVGAGPVFAYRQRLVRASGHSWRQHLIAVDGDGVIVSVHVRTTAERRGRHLDLPTLILCEVGLTGIRRVTELPGDQEAWDHFWS
jgi:ketosteroid isomerase-like protein